MAIVAGKSLTNFTFVIISLHSSINILSVYTRVSFYVDWIRNKLYSDISNTSIFDDPNAPKGNSSSESNSKSSSEGVSLVTIIVIVVLVLMGLPIIAFIIFFIVRYKSKKNKGKSLILVFIKKIKNRFSRN